MKVLIYRAVEAALTSATLFSICHETRVPMANMPTSMTANATRRNCPERLRLLRGFASDDVSSLTSAYTATIPHPCTGAFLDEVRI
jgi:hypothetical protein